LNLCGELEACVIINRYDPLEGRTTLIEIEVLVKFVDGVHCVGKFDIF
jgi:hypothetical protein